VVRNNRVPLAQVVIGSQAWVLVSRTTRTRLMPQQLHELTINPIGGQPPPPRRFACSWGPEREEDLDRVLELATVQGGYRAHLEIPAGELVGAVGTDLFLVAPVPPSRPGAPTHRILRIATTELSPPSPG